MARAGGQAVRRADPKAHLHLAATQPLGRKPIKTFSGSVRLDQIDIERRLRPVDSNWVDVIAKSFDELGQLQPVRLVIEPSGRFLLDGSGAGAHRIAAARQLGWEDVDAVWVRRADVDKTRARLPEIVENLLRNDLDALGRAQHMAEYKEIHEAIYPEARRGGDRGNQHSGGKRRQNEIFSFSHEAAEKTGLSRRAVEIAVSIWVGLSAASRTRLARTALARNQAALRALAVLDPGLQARAIDLLLGDDPPASVADAILLAQGKKPDSIADKLFRNVTGGISRLNSKSRAVIFETYEDEIVALFRKKGIVK